MDAVTIQVICAFVWIVRCCLIVNCAIGAVAVVLFVWNLLWGTLVLNLYRWDRNYDWYVERCGSDLADMSLVISLSVVADLLMLAAVATPWSLPITRM